MPSHTQQIAHSVEPLLLSPAEGMLWYIEEESLGSFRVTVLLRLDGRVEADFLATALQNLQRRHPKLRAVIAKGDDGRLRYHFDQVTPPIPFEITDYEEGEPPWREETRRLMQIGFPSAGPRAAVSVLRSSSRGRSELLLTVHHAVADGLSGIMLMNDLMTEYAGAEAQFDTSPRPALPAITAARAKSSSGWLDRLWLIRRFIRIQREERRSRQTTLPEARDIPPQSQWVLWVFSPKDTLALVRRCRKEQASLGGVLVAAACCGLMECLPVPEAIFKCQFPFNLRDALKGPAGRVTDQDLGCFASIMNEFYEVPQKPVFWELARRAHQDHQTFVQHGGPSFYYNIAAVAASHWFKRAAPTLLPHSARRVTLLATNYGVVSIQDAYGSLRPRECTLMFKNDIVGPPLVLEALVMGQRLNIGFAADGLDPAFWERLQVAVRRHLDAAASADESGPSTLEAPEVPDQEAASQRMSAASQE